MKIAKEIPYSQKQLNDMFSYDRFTGILTYKTSPNFRIKVGSVAGKTSKNGYNDIKINGKLYKGHRIIWIMLFGSIPRNMFIDHINRKRNDNRIENLRLVDIYNGNKKNLPIRKNSYTGINGVTYDKRDNIYKARIGYNGDVIYLGSFINKADAYVRYKWACRKYKFHSNHGKNIIS